MADCELNFQNKLWYFGDYGNLVFGNGTYNAFSKHNIFESPVKGVAAFFQSKEVFFGKTKETVYQVYWQSYIKNGSGKTVVMKMIFYCDSGRQYLVEHMASENAQQKTLYFERYFNGENEVVKEWQLYSSGTLRLGNSSFYPDQHSNYSVSGSHEFGSDEMIVIKVGEKLRIAKDVHWSVKDDVFKIVIHFLDNKTFEKAFPFVKVENGFTAHGDFTFVSEENAAEVKDWEYYANGSLRFGRYTFGSNVPERRGGIVHIVGDKVFKIKVGDKLKTVYHLEWECPENDLSIRVLFTDSSSISNTFYSPRGVFLIQGWSINNNENKLSANGILTVSTEKEEVEVVNDWEYYANGDLRIGKYTFKSNIPESNGGHVHVVGDKVFKIKVASNFYTVHQLEWECDQDHLTIRFLFTNLASLSNKFYITHRGERGVAGRGIGDLPNWSFRSNDKADVSENAFEVINSWLYKIDGSLVFGKETFKPHVNRNIFQSFVAGKHENLRNKQFEWEGQRYNVQSIAWGSQQIECEGTRTRIELKVTCENKVIEFFTIINQRQDNGALEQYSGFQKKQEKKDAVICVDRFRYDDTDDSLTFMSSADSSILFKVTQTEEKDLSNLVIVHAGKQRNVSKIVWRTFHKATRSLLRVAIMFKNGSQMLNYFDFIKEDAKITNKLFDLKFFRFFGNDFGVSEYSGRIEGTFWRTPEKVDTSKVEKSKVESPKVETKSESSSLRLSIRDEIRGLLEETKHVPLTEAQMLRIKQLIEIRGMVQSRINW